MDNNRNFLSTKGKYLVGSIVVLFISAICAAFSMTDHDDFAIARREILLRKIGHELLLQSGDSKSRVLPVKKIAENEYRISFENELTFQPDSLVNITRLLLSKDPLTSDYVVEVLNAGNSAVAFGYAISKSKKDDIVACTGRKQPKANYTVNIKFKSPGISSAKSEFLLGGLPFLAFVGFILFKSGKSQGEPGGNQSTDKLVLGAVLFDVKNRKLIINGITTDLTGTETRVLLIFALSPNKIVERSRLQKEIWEDEGVIVGRSLDMFISKLRKKLELDPNINIVVIRGKGYKLEITA